MKKIIGCLYIVIVFLALIMVEHNRKITNTVISANGVAYEQKVDSVAFGYQLEQPFVPQEEGLDCIGIYTDTTSCSKEQGSLQISVKDDQDNLCFIKDIPLTELPEYGWYNLQLDTKLFKGKYYKLVLESVGCVDFGPKISFYAADLAGTPEQQGYTLTYAGIEVTNAALRIKYFYEVPIKWYVNSVYIIFAGFIGAWLSEKGQIFTKYVYNETENTNNVR